MSETPRNEPLPEIVVCDVDCDRLGDIATAAETRSPRAAEHLLAELERATVVTADALGPSVVRIGSTVTYRPDEGPPRRVTLVLPGEADISAGRISILSPVGTALLGLSADQSIWFESPDGRRHRLTVEAAEPPTPSTVGPNGPSDR